MRHQDRAVNSYRHIGMVFVVGVALAMVATGAGASRTPSPSSTGCRQIHACPANNHQYVWNGLVCATPAAAISGVDTHVIRRGSSEWLCHSTQTYPWHTKIVATTFWVGELFNSSVSDGSQVCSTYDSDWAYHWSGVDLGTVPRSAAGCAGSIIGGCDGVRMSDGRCSTQRRSAANGYFPTRIVPRENPFYLDLPFDDINDPVGFAERCDVIPWAFQPGFAGHCSDAGFSYMKNQWVRILGPNGKTCYGQVEDAGPSHGSLYHDARYVFGTVNARPVQGDFNDAGLDVSPALNGCLGFAELDGDGDRVSWQFVNAAQVPKGPWSRSVTTRQVDER